MVELKKFVKKQVFDVEAYQIDPKARDRDTLQMNQSGYYEPAYHGMITTTHISWVEPGDYIIKMPNEMYVAMKKDDFERLYEPLESTKVVESFPESINAEDKVLNDPYDVKVLGISEVAPTATYSFKLDEDPNEKVTTKKPSAKKKSYKD